jgi:hypothetical protein
MSARTSYPPRSGRSWPALFLAHGPAKRATRLHHVLDLEWRGKGRYDIGERSSMTERARTGCARLAPASDAYTAVCAWKALFQVN